MKSSRVLLLLMASFAASAAAQPVDSLFRSAPCDDARIRHAGDAESAYAKATALLNENKSELGELYMACAVYRGGNAYLFNAGVYFRTRDQQRALEYFLAASALGF